MKNTIRSGRGRRRRHELKGYEGKSVEEEREKEGKPEKKQKECERGEKNLRASEKGKKVKCCNRILRRRNQSSSSPVSSLKGETRSKGRREAVEEGLVGNEKQRVRGEGGP